MNRLLHILGGGLWQIPTIGKAKAIGCRTLVTDMYSERPGYKLADYFEQVDISDFEATLHIAQRYAIDGILCDTTDVGVPTMAWVAERMGLPGMGSDTALNFTNKFRMRESTSRAGLPNPPYVKARSLVEVRKAALPFPFVVKPVDSQSSRGVHVIRDERMMEAFVADAIASSRSHEIIVEGFLEGIETTVESVVVEGKVYAIGVSDKDHYSHRPEVANRLTYPAAFPEPVLQAIRDFNAAVIAALGLKEGITHAEYMVKDGKPMLVEIAARGAGSYVYSDIVPYLAGVDIGASYINHAFGEPFKAIPDGIPRAANLQFFDLPGGRVKAIEGLEEARAIPGVHVVMLEFGLGDVIKPPDDDRSRVGLCVALGKTREEVLQITDRVFNKVKVVFE